MIFVYGKWDKFCKLLSQNGRFSIPAKEVSKYHTNYVVLKHDVETNISNALNIAKIEHKYGHRGSYYVHSYLLDSSNNVEMLKQIQKMGHEVSYHHDVMDSNKGNIDSAITEFENNASQFRNFGFDLTTVC